MNLKTLKINETKYEIPDPAEEIENALEEAKDSGEFDGPQGPQGPAYELTEEDKMELVSEVLAALPVWEGGSY